MAHHYVAIFDLGGVVIDWNPRYLYRKLFNGSGTAMEGFPLCRLHIVMERAARRRALVCRWLRFA
jgi:hypothetical protein